MADFMTRKWKKYLVMVAKNGFAFGVDSEYFLLQFVLEVQKVDFDNTYFEDISEFSSFFEKNWKKFCWHFTKCFDSKM